MSMLSRYAIFLMALIDYLLSTASSLALLILLHEIDRTRIKRVLVGF